MSQPLLQVSHLSRSFPRGKIALKDISFSLQAGEIVALLGDNGAGKTTLLKILAQVMAPSGGTIHLPLSRSQVAWVPSSENNFTPLLTGEENLRYWHAFQKGEEKIWQQTVENFMALPVFREAFATPYVFCSSGMKQCLSVARAFLKDPALLLLDEPMRSLDISSVNWLVNYLQHSGSTILFSSHQEPVVDALAQRRLLLQGGRLG